MKYKLVLEIETSTDQEMVDAASQIDANKVPIVAGVHEIRIIKKSIKFKIAPKPNSPGANQA